ncbi:MAG: GntR family transcriptional regulator [Ktedonobacteraceae bacterium]|nr:GntR family transcriptional regulator [Ktedonobacteraceae bacterium]
MPHLHSFSDEIRHLGYEPGAQLLSQQEIVADQYVATQLQIAVGSPVLSLRRLRTADGQPIFVSDSWVALARFPALRLADYATTSLYRLFEQTTGRRIVRATQWIGVARAEQDIAQYLGIEADSPVLWLQRLTYVEGNVPVESVRAFFHPERYRHYSELAVYRAPQQPVRGRLAQSGQGAQESNSDTVAS